MTCRYCGKPHSDWLSCDQAAVMDAPPVPYTSGGFHVERECSLTVIDAKYDRSKAMREWHARRIAEKGLEMGKKSVPEKKGGGKGKKGC